MPTACATFIVLIWAADFPRIQSGASVSPGWGGGEKLRRGMRSDTLTHSPILFRARALPSRSCGSSPQPCVHCRSAWHLPSPLGWPSNPKVVWPFKASFLSRAHVFFGNYKAFRAFFTTFINNLLCYIYFLICFIPRPLLFSIATLKTSLCLWSSAQSR